MINKKQFKKMLVAAFERERREKSANIEKAQGNA